MTNSQLPVAIVGMAVLLPGARGLDAYWHNLRSRCRVAWRSVVTFFR
ncbi:beta-ketoacyl synthase N-terminal-like domain-containing protein [Streptomyces sp. SID6137]|nr:hypothetical protein [Streptomyces sp. SID6137]